MMNSLTNTPEWWSARAREYDDPWEAACWSKHSQDVRFHAVRALLKIAGGDSVLDYGCGTGAFCGYLPALGPGPVHRPEEYEAAGVTYFAFDWASGMRARARREWPRAVVLDELDDDLVFDHVVCIGTFNLTDNWSVDKTLETLTELWTRTRKTLVVSLYSGAEKPGMLTYDVSDATYIAELLSHPGAPRLTLTNEHLPNDLILRMGKEA